MKQNVILDLKDSNLVVDFGEDFIEAERSKTFFSFLLKCYYSKDRNKFISNPESELREILNQTTEFLKKRSINFTLSDQLKSYQKDLSISEEEFQLRIKKALDLKKRTFKETRLDGFERKLKGYQYKGFQHLVTMRSGANFSVPGSGKTTVAYAYANRLLKDGEIDKILVVGPRSSFLPWEEEYRQCFANKPSLKRISGSVAVRRKIYSSAGNYSIFLVTYQTAANDIEELVSLLRRFKFLVILDESHYIKRFLKGYWADQILKLAKFAQQRLILTGTPAPNSFEDLWNQINFIWPDRRVLGEPQRFKNLCKDKSAWSKIKQSIAPLYTRATKKDLNLPIPKFEKIEVKLSPLQEQIYRALAVKFISELKEPPEVTNKLREWRKAKLVRLIEASTNPSLLSRFSEEFRVPPLDSKNFNLTEIIEHYSEHEFPAKFLALMNEINKRVQKGEKIIVWTSFIHNIKMISKLLKKENITFARIYGEIPKDFSEDEEDNREKEIIRFKTDKDTLVLLANPAACSESISLHKICKHAIYLDRTFNCGQYLQSLDRIHRLGLANDDEIIYKILITKGTVDEVIDRRLAKKAKTMEMLLSDDLNVGAFDTNATDVIGNESEEKQDFDATVQDLLYRYGENTNTNRKGSKGF